MQKPLKDQQMHGSFMRWNAVQVSKSWATGYEQGRRNAGPYATSQDCNHAGVYCCGRPVAAGAAGLADCRTTVLVDVLAPLATG